MLGIHYGAPLKWSAAFGEQLPGTVGGWKPFVAAEPGLGGWRASVGAAKMSEVDRGLVARATLLRTAGNPWRATSRATYVGPELQLMPMFTIGGRIGGLIRVGDKGGRRELLTLDASLMF